MIFEILKSSLEVIILVRFEVKHLKINVLYFEYSFTDVLMFTYFAKECILVLIGLLYKFIMYLVIYC